MPRQITLPRTITAEIIQELALEAVNQLGFAITEAALMHDARRNNLAASNLVASIDYIITPNGIDIIANEYWITIERGRPARQYTDIPEYEDLYAWARRYRLRPARGTFASMVWAIRQSIIRNGYRARPFVANAVTRLQQVSPPIIERIVLSHLET